MIQKILNILKTTFAKATLNKNIDYSTWIFSSSFNTKYNYNSKYLFEYVLNNEPEINPVYVINDDDLRHKLQSEYGEKYFIETKSIKGIKKVLNSGVWFTSAGLPVYGLNLNNDRIIINLWHGVPLKKIALMERNAGKLTKIYFKRIFSNNYTHILTTSKNLIEIMGESFNVPNGKIKTWGQPRNDALFKENNREEILDKIYNNLPSYKKVILYAPTYRDGRNTKIFPFNDLNINELNKFLEEEKLIIFLRYHQSETNDDFRLYGDRIQFVNSDKVDEIMDIINIFDLLITDYSSIYIDYLLTEKPILFLPYDKEQYLKERGMNFKYDDVTPGPKPKTFETLKKDIKKLLYDNEYFEFERKKINLYFNEINKPCSNKICNHIKEEISNLTK